MKKSVPVPVVAVVVIAVIAICGYVYSQQQIGIKFPEPGTKPPDGGSYMGARKFKNDAIKKKQEEDKAKSTDGQKSDASEKKADPKADSKPDAG